MSRFTLHGTDLTGCRGPFEGDSVFLNAPYSIFDEQEEAYLPMTFVSTVTAHQMIYGLNKGNIQDDRIKTTKMFRATITIDVAVDNESEAEDCLAETLREHLRRYTPESCIVDWAHLEEVREMTPEEVYVTLQIEQENG